MDRSTRSTRSTEPDPRIALVPILLACLSGSLLLTDRFFDGTALTVARIVLLVALVTAVAWCSRMLGWWRTDGDAQG